MNSAPHMRALVFRGHGSVAVESIAIPEPGPGEVLVRVSVCGVCGSDAAEVDHGPVLSAPPVVLGHEFVGTIESVGEGVRDLIPGATVVCGAGISCGACRMCRRGRTNLCESYRTAGLQIDGGLAEFTVVPASILLDVSDSGVPMDTLGLAQPMSIAVHAVRRSGLAPGGVAVIVGVGGIGSFLTIAASAVASRVLVIDLDSSRLELARRLGATDALDPATQSLSEWLVELELEPDVFFEVSGSRSGWQSVVDAAARGATIVPVGIQARPTEVELAQWTVREYTIVGTNAHVFAEDLPEAVRLLATRDDWSDLAPDVIPLDDVVESALKPLSAGASTRIKTLADPRIGTTRRANHSRS
jgi:(R,R)-butanediol dehydrogenase/meso-butanediol dehydrogenase/diacetyl reductase